MFNNYTMGSFLKIFILEITIICGLAVEMNTQLRSESRCSGEMFYIPDNNVCPTDTRLLPRQIILGYNNNSNCSGLLHVGRTYWINRQYLHSLCCSASKGDCNETFHLPTDDTKLLNKYQQFLKQCSSVHPGHCSITKESSSSPLLSVCSSETQITYMEFFYECINVTSIHYFTVSRTISSTNPHIILSGVTGIMRSECVAYTTDCTSSITVSVADVVLEKTSSCYLSISDGRTNFTTQTCLDHRMYTQPIFSSHTNYIRLNLTTNTSKTSDQLWLQITASSHATVIVACGADAYNFNTTGCTTQSTTETSTYPRSSNIHSTPGSSITNVRSSKAATTEHTPQNVSCSKALLVYKDFAIAVSIVALILFIMLITVSAILFRYIRRHGLKSRSSHDATSDITTGGNHFATHLTEGEYEVPIEQSVNLQRNNITPRTSGMSQESSYANSLGGNQQPYNDRFSGYVNSEQNIISSEYETLDLATMSQDTYDKL